MEKGEKITEKTLESGQTCATQGCIFKRMRDGLQQGIYLVINPFVRFLIRIGVTPNMVTAVGLLGSFVSTALVFRCGYEVYHGQEVNFSWLLWAGIVNILFSVFDMLDGQVARLGNMTTVYGAFYDSVLDRFSEFFVTGSLAMYFAFNGNIAGLLITLFATMGSLMVSYVRARGESLGVVAKVGLMQRPERVVLTALALIAAGWAGLKCSDPNVADIILMSAMGLIAVLANLTAIVRISFCRKHLS